MPGFHANASHTLYSEQAILTLPSEFTSSVLATGAMNAANVTYITKLPAEILLEVWIHLIDMPLQEVKKTDTARVDISPIPISALHLSQVCKYWRIAILNFPTLWARTDVCADWIYNNRVAFAAFMRGGGSSAVPYHSGLLPAGLYSARPRPR